MDWNRAGAVLDRFEGMSRMTIKELKLHYRQIQKVNLINPHNSNAFIF